MDTKVRDKCRGKWDGLCKFHCQQTTLENNHTIGGDEQWEIDTSPSKNTIAKFVSLHPETKRRLAANCISNNPFVVKNKIFIEFSLSIVNKFRFKRNLAEQIISLAEKFGNPIELQRKNQFFSEVYQSENSFHFCSYYFLNRHHTGVVVEHTHLWTFD